MAIAADVITFLLNKKKKKKKKWNGLVVDQLWFGVESLLRIVPTWWL
jgi:hypothetical protein